MALTLGRGGGHAYLPPHPLPNGRNKTLVEARVSNSATRWKEASVRGRQPQGAEMKWKKDSAQVLYLYRTMLAWGLLADFVYVREKLPCILLKPLFCFFFKSSVTPNLSLIDHSPVCG